MWELYFISFKPLPVQNCFQECVANITFVFFCITRTFWKVLNEKSGMGQHKLSFYQVKLFYVKTALLT